VLDHPALRQRWHGTFEQAEVPDSTYDFAYASYVAEHVADGRPFFEKLARVLKPGGVFLSITPNASHPFARICRIIQRTLGKKLWSKFKPEINLYPAYYRLNTPRQVLGAIEGLPFESVEFFYVPCLHWDMYFPKFLRWAPHLYDRLLGIHYGPAMLTLGYRLVKSVGGRASRAPASMGRGNKVQLEAFPGKMAPHGAAAHVETSPAFAALSANDRPAI
jgi:SAM-dependent methyltransferase